MLRYDYEFRSDDREYKLVSKDWWCGSSENDFVHGRFQNGKLEKKIVAPGQPSPGLGITTLMFAILNHIRAYNELKKNIIFT